MAKMVPGLLFLMAAGGLAGQAGFAQDAFPAKDGEVTITFVGHGTLVFQWGPLVVHVDPVGEYGDYAKLPKADLVLVTHDHADHLDAAAIAAVTSAEARLEQAKADCRKAIEACESAVRIYARISPAEHADALKNLGYSFITLAEIEDKAENCHKAIDACESALQYYTLDTAPQEHADILRDLAFAHVTLSAVEDKEECSKKALKFYKKAYKLYRASSEELEREGDPGAHEMREQAEKCHRSMQSCKAIFKAGRKAGEGAAAQSERSGA